MADANAGRFLKDKIKWLTTREKQTKLFVGDASGNWVNPVHDVAFVDHTGPVDWWHTAARTRPGWAEELDELLHAVRALPSGRTLDVTLTLVLRFT